MAVHFWCYPHASGPKGAWSERRPGVVLPRPRLQSRQASPDKFPPIVLYAAIDLVFDNFVEMHDGSIVGGMGKEAFFDAGVLKPYGFKDRLPAPCIEAVEALRALFKPLYASAKQTADTPSSEAVQVIFDTSLDSSRDNEWWPDDGSEYIRDAYPPRKRRWVSDAGSPVTTVTVVIRVQPHSTIH
ncbi:hypothetical protein FA95DRAFT_685140 [Auriscalpium vulgare]|uniref:Uncharacterized protein n=1 Tax=Auriscalpium vulgare TaxID=40419 RepID=A0ACB8S1F4_9AGAM|nr:hypothetical protein FA95DRAFT_685140 [Auriscalpium vulgare]